MRFCRHSGGGRHKDGRRQPDLSLSRGGLHNSSFIGDDTRRCVLSAEGTWLHDVWARMKERSLKNIPVGDQESRALGLLDARDILQVLLKNSEDEESMLRDYVMGLGY